MKKNILITGGCGFIGLNLVDLLRRKPQFRIRIIDNLSTGSYSDLSAIVPCSKSKLNQLTWKKPIQFIQADIKNFRLAQKLTCGADIIIHLAAETGVIPSIKRPRKDALVNIMGTLNYLEALKRNQGQKFIFASSSAPLGHQKAPLHEKKIPHPLSPYGASKLAGEGYSFAFSASYGLQTIVLRFSNVYGEWSYAKGSVVAEFFKNIVKGKPLRVYGDGNQTRDFVYVGDLCHAILKAIDYDGSGELFQIASGRETSINSLIALIKKTIGKKRAQSLKVQYLHQRPGEVRRSFSRISFAKQKLKYSPKVDLKSGLKETWRWYRKKL